ncbi:hypothetical protein D9758_016164 [Tetrapyrgos nigripes]|uniref:Glucose-methanol-choline oxidoreductase N-terminal domain-containing protein n=1 Tax=Tetrapyrgos nigripes TaxID=182062 RepID=A0A8H5CHE9_9AGAR|nr:hypothetical protein D9758_016164 [Tetrapyrgos nigripes]
MINVVDVSGPPKPIEFELYLNVVLDSLGIERTTMSDTVYDILFAGGGTAACLAAGQLAAAYPSLRILIIEAGEHTKNLDAHTQPVQYFSHLAPTSKTVDFNVGKPSENIRGRSLITPSARCLGGGSSVNFAMYTRAAASDYDDWETVHENPGWDRRIFFL